MVHSAGTRLTAAYRNPYGRTPVSGVSGCQSPAPPLATSTPKMGRTVPILGAGRRSRGICDRNALTCTGYSTDCFWHLPRSFGTDLGVVRRAAERQRHVRAYPRCPTTGFRWRITSFIRHAQECIAGQAILEPVGMELETGCGGTLNVTGPIEKRITVAARAARRVDFL